MIRIITMLFLFALFFGCSAKPMAPTIDIYTFKENNYPCTMVEFPDQIRLKDVTLERSEGTVAVIYDLVMPGYNIQVVKMYAGELGWSLDSLASLHSNSSKLYEINGDVSIDKSAVISFVEMDKELYLKGSVAEFLQEDRAIRVDVFRRIKKIGTFKKDNLENWKNSATGNRSIINMRNIVDYIYGNITSIECKYKQSIDMDWWN